MYSWRDSPGKAEKWPKKRSRKERRLLREQQALKAAEAEYTAKLQRELRLSLGEMNERLRNRGIVYGRVPRGGPVWHEPANEEQQELVERSVDMALIAVDPVTGDVDVGGKAQPQRCDFCGEDLDPAMLNKRYIFTGTVDPRETMKLDSGQTSYIKDLAFEVRACAPCWQALAQQIQEMLWQRQEAGKRVVRERDGVYTGSLARGSSLW